MADAFDPRVIVRGSDECWEWSGPRLPTGYGRFGRRYAHRSAWEAANGRALGPGEIVLHACDNPPCCNPAHLRAGTTHDNIEDKCRKGRASGGSLPGAANPFHKLTDERVMEIRRAYAGGGETYKSIALLHGLAPGHVHRIVTGACWGHLPVLGKGKALGRWGGAEIDAERHAKAIGLLAGLRGAPELGWLP